jgi:DNA-binding response OmpR family regulator
MSYRLLLIDDDHRLYDLLLEYLSGHGYSLSHAPDGPRGLAALEDDSFDAILLDVMMPGMDGFEVLRRVREKGDVPVLMLTARGDDTDRIVGLEMGADDYLPKPFNPRELLARVRAVLRRSSMTELSDKLTHGDLTADVGARVVTRGDEEIELTAAEFDLLVAMMRRQGRVVTRAGLLDAAGRGDVFVSDRTVDVHISHLRQKLEEDPRTPRLIKTVRGVGYVFAKEE